VPQSRDERFLHCVFGEGEIAEHASQGRHRWPVRLPEGACDLIHQPEFLAAAVLGS
jgi:hypothetical protein